MKLSHKSPLPGVSGESTDSGPVVVDRLLYDLDGAAGVLSVSCRTVRELVRSGAIPVAVIPSPAHVTKSLRRTLIHRDSLSKFAASCVQEGGR